MSGLAQPIVWIFVHPRVISSINHISLQNCESATSEQLAEIINSNRQIVINGCKKHWYEV